MAEHSSRKRSWGTKLAAIVAGVGASFALTNATPAHAKPVTDSQGSKTVEIPSKRRFRKLVLRRSVTGSVRVAQHESHESHASHSSHSSHVSGFSR